MSTDLADVIVEPCTGVEYLTRSSGWVAIDAALVPPAAITRPAEHDWGPWSKGTSSRHYRSRRCRRCRQTAYTMPRTDQ